MAAAPYPAYGCDMPGVLGLPDGGCALSGLRVPYACGFGFGFAGWWLRLIRPTVTKLLKPRRPDKRLRAIRQWNRA